MMQIKSVYIVFNVQSVVSCYREKVDNITWIINLLTSKAEGIYISNFSPNMNFDKFAAEIKSRSVLKDSFIDKIICDLKGFKKGM